MSIMRICETTACEWGIPIPMFGLLCTGGEKCEAVKSAPGSNVGCDSEDTRCTQQGGNSSWIERGYE